MQQGLSTEFLVLFEHPEIGIVALRGYGAMFDSSLHGAVRLMGMGARREAAFPRCLQHFREIKGNFLLFQVNQPETSQAWRIYQETTRGNRVHLI